MHRSTWYLVHDDTCNYRDRRKGDKYTRIQRSRDLVNIVCKSNADFHFAALRAGRCKKKCALKFDRAWDYVRYEDPWSSGVMVDDRYVDISSTRVIKS